jgi:hypothetical protein
MSHHVTGEANETVAVLYLCDDRTNDVARIGFGSDGIGIATREDGERYFGSVVAVRGEDMYALRELLNAYVAEEAFVEPAPSAKDPGEYHGTLLVDNSGFCEFWVYSGYTDQWYSLAEIDEAESFLRASVTATSTYVGFDHGARGIIGLHGLADVSDGFRSSWAEGDVVSFSNTFTTYVLVRNAQDGWDKYRDGALIGRNNWTDEGVTNLVDGEHGEHYCNVTVLVRKSA